MLIASVLSSLGQDGGLPGPCEGKYGTRRTLRLEGVHLYVPDATQDKAIRWMLDQGGSLDKAYRQMGLLDELPPQGMKACCSEVLRTKWYNPESGRWERSSWGNTCAGYYQCFVDYVEALREMRIRGRIKIAEGLYSPSPEEELCIRKRFVTSGNVARAYSECGATDILPTFPGAIDGLNRLLSSRESASTPLYKTIKTLYQLQPGALPGHQAPQHAPPEDEKKLNYWLYAGIGVAAALLISRR